MKTNVKILPAEKLVLQKVASLSGLKTINRLICVAVGVLGTREQIRAAIQRESAPIEGGNAPIKRLQISVRLSDREAVLLKQDRMQRETQSDEVRRILGLRPISELYRPAAYATSQRGSGPTVTVEMAAAYFRLAAALMPIVSDDGGAL